MGGQLHRAGAWHALRPVGRGIFWSIGRFLGVGSLIFGRGDSIGFKDDIDLDVYVRANPISNFDPTGLDCVAVGLSVTCSFPGGPTVQFPRPPGWPATIAPNSPNYHNYDVAVPTNCPADKMA